VGLPDAGFMTDKCSAGDQDAHSTTAQPPVGGSIRVGLSGGGSLTAGADLDTGPVPTPDLALGPPPPSPHGDPATGGNAGGEERVVRIGSPAALLAIVPQLLTFEPQLSLVVLGAEPPRGRVRLTVRFDLPKTPDLVLADEIAQRAMGVLVAQGFQAGVAVGYGPGRLVTPVADAVRRRAADLGFRLQEVLRAEAGRYWSYLCTEPSCCSPDGEPYDVAGHPVTAAFAEAGAPPVLASREEVAALVAPLDGPEGEAMFQATLRAEERSDRLIGQAASSGRRGAARRLIGTAGLDAVSEAIDAYRAGGQFSSDADAAWLLVALQDLRVRDDAWSRMDPDHMEDHQRLWTDLTRRARPGYVAAPASLLAFIAWQRGNGALANVALDRAQADNPGYSMARLLREAVDSGAPPRLARLPMTPEEVAASYEEAGKAGEAGEREFGDTEFGVSGDDADLDDDGYDLDEEDPDGEDDCDDNDDPGASAPVARPAAAGPPAAVARNCPPDPRP
jgi:hypothetical protein